VRLIAEDRERADRGARAEARGRALALIPLAIAALGFAIASAVAFESDLSEGNEAAGLGIALIAGWLAVFGAISVLYAYERRRPEGEAQDSEGPVAFRADPEPRGVWESGSESFSVTAEAGRPTSAPETRLASPGAGARSPEAASDVPPPPRATRPTPPAGTRTPHASDARSCLERCAELRRAGRFDEAVRLARAALADPSDHGPLLIELSRAEFGLGRVEAAIEAARDAHFASRSRASASYLIRLLIATRRLAPGDGASLRRAAVRHPGQPLLRLAAGVFESMYGEPCAAEEQLRAALRLGPDAAMRRAIERELAHLQEVMARAGAAGRPDRGGSGHDRL
jgi:tetratricopeptide (TPR) repeat protein